MERNYEYFKRDISWLSFNYRVLLEAEDDSLPIYERINFISIYSSNLEEFYKIRVAEHKAIISGSKTDETTVQQSMEIIHEITEAVNTQMEERVRIYEQKILPTLKQNNIILYQSHNVEDFHQSFVSNFFNEEIFPYLQPVPVDKENVTTFLRDNRLYMAVRLYKMKEYGKRFYYFIMKLPYSKVPRFIELPKYNSNYYIMFMEDIIKANVQKLFPGFTLDSSYCFKISRDADILIDEVSPDEDIVEKIKKKVKKRKIGNVCRFVYERKMPDDFLAFLTDSFNIKPDELVPGDKHLNLEDLRLLPNPNKNIVTLEKPKPMKLNCLNEKESITQYVSKQDLLVHFPYHSFDHFIHFLYEAVHDPSVSEIMITQYRVAENSSVINTLISAAQNGKKVTVFVELKARFDEENNLATAEMMKKSGINIIYSIPKLKVHAKVALVLRKNKWGRRIRSYAYISTGNFNEKTAKLYADTGLFTCNKSIVTDLYNLFRILEKKELTITSFNHLLVTQFNLTDELKKLIQNEINITNEGKRGRIVLKMNALQDPDMINELYRASEAGVEIDLIIRGICCLIPGQSYSKNIRITRIVDTFLEHTRIWYFGNDGNPQIFLGSPDWMRRNLYRRIEVVTPILSNSLKQEIIDMLHLQLQDNTKGCWVDSKLHNIFKKVPDKKEIRAQYLFYDYLKDRNEAYLSSD